MKKRWVSLLSPLAAVLLLFSLISCGKVYIDEAERFIRADASVQSKVGEVTSLTRTRTIVVGAAISTENKVSPGYHVYEFIVRGARRKAFLSVQVNNPHDPSKRSFAIESIEDL